MLRCIVIVVIKICTGVSSHDRFLSWFVFGAHDWFDNLASSESSKAEGEEMSMEYCEDCDKIINLDWDVEHFQRHRVPNDLSKTAEKVDDMKLKTLKDLKLPEKELIEISPLCLAAVERLIEEIRSEAVKWVKENDKEMCEINWRDVFMEFINITEEDLK